MLRWCFDVLLWRIGRFQQAQSEGVRASNFNLHEPWIEWQGRMEEMCGVCIVFFLKTRTLKV